MPKPQDVDKLRDENEALRQQLAEATETLRAIRSGEVDALVVGGTEGDRLYTLESAYEPYRVFVEHMQEGAAALTADGIVVYANPRFAGILGVAQEKVLGTSVFELFGDRNRGILRRMLAEATDRPAQTELAVRVNESSSVHVYLSVTPAPDGTRCIVMTDVTARVQLADAVATRDWLRVTLTSIGDAVISCDLDGNVTFFNTVAAALTGWLEREAIGRPIDQVFHIVDELTGEATGNPVSRVLAEGKVVLLGNHTALVARDGRHISIEDSAAPIRDDDGNMTGAVLVFHDVTEKRRFRYELEASEARLRQSTAELEKANRVKDEFFATLSHELRTPMSAIVGWAQILTARKMDPPTVERGLKAILRNAEAQTQLINDMLDVSRIVSGRLRLDIEPVDLVAVVYRALDAVRPAADAKGISLKTSISASSPVIPADGDRVQQVVWNLLSNAVKFTPKGGTVTVSLRQTGSQFVVAVQDDGIGIAPAFLPHVFERFSQEDTSLRRQHGGLGLGLSIVRHLVELHGGIVEAESEGEGKGATFTVRLPVRAVELVPHADDEEMSQREPQPFTGSLAGIRVLVVDDEADAREVIATVLTGHGAEVATASSAAEALDRLCCGTFDVLVADIGMPHEDGYELARAVRCLPADANPGIAAIALTAYGRSTDAEAALAAGFQVHLTKPVMPGVLASTIAQLVRGQAAEGRA